MYKFSKYKIKKGTNYYVLSCDVILQYENVQDESYNGGWSGAVTPSCWDDEIIGRIKLIQHHIYHLYGIQLPHGQYNKLSDYKGVHKLTNRPFGEYESSYNTPDGKVYAGISFTCDVDGLNSNVSPILIVGTTLNHEQFHKILSLLKDDNYDFCAPPTLSLLEAISTCCPESVVLNYSSVKESTLTIFPGNADLCFTEADCQRWESLDDVQAIVRRN